MASAIIPLIAELAPSIIDLIVNLVHKAAPVVEQQLGPGTGPVKFANVFSSVMGDLTKAAEAGQISKTLPPDPVVQLIIQAAVSSLNASGLLKALPVADTTGTLPAGTQTVTLSSGQSVVIQVK